MENKARLRVQKKKTLKRGKKHLIKRVVDYLKSDSYMYAPLFSPLLADFCSPDTLSSDKVTEVKKQMVENKPFREQVGEYMKSDVYMYAPMVGAPRSPHEFLPCSGRIRMAVSTTRLTMKVNQSTDHLGNVNQRSENRLPLTRLSDQHSQGHKETVKHNVYQSCHTAASGLRFTGANMTQHKTSEELLK